MNDIRKLSVGTELNHLMVYTIGQRVINETCEIHKILRDFESKMINVFVLRGNEIIMWKSISMRVPHTIEYNIDFQ